MRSLALLVLFMLSSQITFAEEPVPGCPAYLQKSLVTWRKKSGGNIWEMRNVSNIGVAVTYIKEPGNWRAGLNPGESKEVRDVLDEPPYVVRSLKEVSELETRDIKKYVECLPENEYILASAISNAANAQDASGQMHSGSTPSGNSNSIKKNIATAEACPSEVVVTSPGSRGAGMQDMEGFELISMSPPTIRSKFGTMFTTSMQGAGNAGDVQWRFDSPTTDIDRILKRESEKLASEESRIASCSNACCSDAAHYCLANRDNKKQLVQWLQCVVASRDANGTSADDYDVDVVTPQVPGCPRYLRKSLVVWTPKHGSNPQFNVWEVRNVSKRILNVTYRKDGNNNDTRTLNPGDADEVWGIRNRPPYVVRDFDELVEFNSTHNATKELQLQALQCKLKIRPR